MLKVFPTENNTNKYWNTASQSASQLLLQLPAKLVLDDNYEGNRIIEKNRIAKK